MSSASILQASELPDLGAPWMADRPWIDDDNRPIDPFLAGLSGNLRADMLRRLETWRSEGVVVFPNAIPRALIDEFLDDIETLKADPRGYHIELNHMSRRFYSDDLSKDIERRDFNDSYFRICQIHLISKVALQLALVPEIAQFISIIFQQPVVPMQTLTFLKSSQQPIHIDYPYVKAQRRLAFMLASWIPLEDVHPDAGPLVYYPGAHKPAISGFFEWEPGKIVQHGNAGKNPTEFAAYLTARMAKHQIAARIFLPRKGDVLLWHGNLPHAGSPIRNAALTRRSLVTHYTSLDSTPAWWTPDRSRMIVDNAFGMAWETPGSPVSKLPSWQR